jgi:CRP-like cAMP-binding protein
MDASPKSGTDLREQAALMLMEMAPMSGITLDEAELILDAMRPVQVPADTLLCEEGDAEDTDFMMLVLDGQVRAETRNDAAAQDVVISIVGPGGLIGEMGVIDGGPRSAKCTALTDLKLGVLSREGLMKLLHQHPAAASRLLLMLSKGLVERLRESNRRLRTMSQLTRALQSELSAVHAVNRRLLDTRG